MYNLLLAGAAAAVAFLIGLAAAGWVAGIVPALLAFVVAFLLLARRTNKQVEALAASAMARLQAGDAAGARATLESGLPLGRWQVLVEAQLYGQIGQLDAMQAVGLLMQRQLTAADAAFESAAGALARSWSRDWRSRAMLGVVHQRRGRHAEAVAVLEEASAAGSGEPLFWGFYAWVLNEARERDRALAVIGRGLAANAGNKALVAIQEALSNRRRPDFGAAFGDPWYQVFPDQMSQEQLVALYEQSTGKKVPPGARIGAPGPVRPGKTPPPPRR